MKKLIGMSLPGEEQKLSGPIGISSVFGDRNIYWWVSFLYTYTAFVVVLNFLPVPKSAMLEIIPLGYEAVTRKRFGNKTFRIIRQVAIWLLVLLMVWQFVSDILMLL